MRALPIVEAPLERAAFEDAVDLYRVARRTGLTVRSSVDRLIAVCAVRNDLTLLHRDRDFDRIARIAPLRSRNVGTRLKSTGQPSDVIDTDELAGRGGVAVSQRAARQTRAVSRRRAGRPR